MINKLSRTPISAKALFALPTAGVMIVVTAYYGLGFRGSSTEVVMIQLALERTGLASFLYPYDNARVLLLWPYGLAELLPGNIYVGLALISAFLLSAIFLLTWSLAKQLHLSTVSCFVAGVFAGLAPLDASSHFFGMIIVHAAIFLALASIRLILTSTTRNIAAMKLAVAAALFFCSVFTYDAILLPLLGSWLVVAVTRQRGSFRLGIFAISMAMLIIWFSQRILGAQPSDYVQRRLSSSTPGNSIENLGGLVGSLGPSGFIERLAWLSTISLFGVLVISLTLLLTGLSIWLAVSFDQAKKGGPVWSNHRQLWRTGAVMALLAVLAVLPYLLVDNAFKSSGPWRSMLAASVPIGLLLGVLLTLSQHRFSALTTRIIALTLLFSTLLVTYADQALFKVWWDRYATLIASILEEVPQVKDGTLLVLRDQANPSSTPLPGSLGQGPLHDALRSATWLNASAQLMYPDTEVVATYLTKAGQWAPDIAIDYEEGGVVRILDADVGVEVDSFSRENVTYVDVQPEIDSEGLTRGWQAVSAPPRKSNRSLAVCSDIVSAVRLGCKTP